MPSRRSRTSWYTPSLDELCMFHPVGPSDGARLGRPRRRRPRRPARRADAAVVLHRWRLGAGACRVPARRGAAPRARPASAVGSRLRRAGVVRVREPGRDPRPGSEDRAPHESSDALSALAVVPRLAARDRRRRRDRRVHDPRRVARPGARAAEGSRLRARARACRRHARRAPPAGDDSSRGRRGRGLRGRFTGSTGRGRATLAARRDEALSRRPARRAGARLGRGHRAGEQSSRSTSTGSASLEQTRRRLSVKLVLDWDGTVTEVDGLHLVLLEFGDEEIYEARRVPARARPDAARGHRGRVPVRPAPRSRGRRVRARERSRCGPASRSFARGTDRSSSRAASTS